MFQELTSWVVYLTPVYKKQPMKAVCEQCEWEAMELSRPGFHTLIQSGIATEGEAEKVARDEPAEVSPKAAGWRPKLRKNALPPLPV